MLQALNSIEKKKYFKNTFKLFNINQNSSDKKNAKNDDC